MHSIDKSREDKKDSGNTGIEGFPWRSVCGSVEGNGRFADGQVLPVLVRMKDVLSAGV